MVNKFQTLLSLLGLHKCKAMEIRWYCMVSYPTSFKNEFDKLKNGLDLLPLHMHTILVGPGPKMIAPKPYLTKPN